MNIDRKKLSNISGVQAAIAVRTGAEFLLRESKRFVPHDTGMLENSGDIDFEATKGKATVFYSTPYAVQLHENPHYNFQKGRKGKWLESASREKAALVGKLIAETLKGEIK